MLRITLFLTILFLEVSFVSHSNKADLAPDEVFRAPFFAENNRAARCLLLSDGRFVLYFNVNTLNDQRIGPIKRYWADGSLDSSFHLLGPYQNAGAVADAGNGKLHVAAAEYAYGRKLDEKVLHLNQDGSVENPT